MTDTPRIGAPDWAAAQASPWLTVNEAARYFDAFSVRVVVEDRSLTAPPASCADGSCYLVAATATGLWAGEDGSIAIAKGTNASNGWLFVPESAFGRQGNEIHVNDEGVDLIWDGSDWQSATIVRVNLTGISDGDYLRWDASNGIFYGSPT